MGSLPVASADLEMAPRPVVDDEPESRVRALSGSELFELVYRQMHSLTGGRARDLDDLVQAAVEHVLRGLPGFEGRSRLSTWTYRICYLTMLKQRRWYRRWLRRFTFAVDGELPEPADSERAAPPGEAEERAQRLRCSVERLSAKRRAVVVLHDLEDVAVEEIATIVGANVLTVRSRLRDGRRDLANLLASDPYFGDEACRRRVAPAAPGRGEAP